MGKSTFVKLERYEAALKQARAARAEESARRELRRTVRDLIPRSAKVPKRPKGRTAVGGVSRKEVAALRAKAQRYLEGVAGLHELEAAVQHTAIVILLIDGVLGTEPWRAAGGPHAGLVAANARLRYLENAARLLDDLRRRVGAEEPKLLEGVIDAEPVDAQR